MLDQFLSAGHEISALNQMSWLMKTAGIELRVTSLNRQRSHTQRLLHLLLDDVPMRSYTSKLLRAHRHPTNHTTLKDTVIR